MELSVIIPVYNEEKNLLILHRELAKALQGKDYELLFVNDGSTDRSLALLKEFKTKDTHIRIIDFSRNFGQTAAFQAGFDHAKGSIIVTLDADLQNDPADIPLLLDKIAHGFDVVSGWRHERKDPIGKTIPSRFSNWLARKLTKVQIHDSGCSLKAYRREAVEGIQLYGEMHRYIPALCFFRGASVGEVKVNHRPRRFGKTKYGWKRLINGSLDLMYVTFWGSYSTKPLHFLGFLGIIQYALAAIIFIEQAIKAVMLRRLDLGPLLLMGVLLIITGTLFIIFGFILEILIRSYYMKSGEKPYALRR